MRQSDVRAPWSGRCRARNWVTLIVLDDIGYRSSTPSPSSSCSPQCSPCNIPSHSSLVSSLLNHSPSPPLLAHPYISSSLPSLSLPPPPRANPAEATVRIPTSLSDDAFERCCVCQNKLFKYADSGVVLVVLAKSTEFGASFASSSLRSASASFALDAFRLLFSTRSEYAGTPLLPLEADHL